MDTSKAIGIIIANPEFEDVRSLEGTAPTKNPCVPIIAVPTTAGTAAEVTINYVITDVEKKRKFVCVDPHDMPVIAVVDPEMMSSMPKGLTASTGMDVSERPDVYVGKKVRFKGQVLKNKYFKDKNFVPGRKVMTCCAEDTQFIGYISFYNNIASLENRQWIMVTATIKNEFQMAYKKKGPVLYVEKVENAEPPVEEMVYF